MLFAVDYNDNRVHIDETHSNQEYYCPYCGAPLTTKKGEIRQHHFAHKQVKIEIISIIKSLHRHNAVLKFNNRTVNHHISTMLGISQRQFYFLIFFWEKRLPVIVPRRYIVAMTTLPSIRAQVILLEQH